MTFNRPHGIGRGIDIVPVPHSAEESLQNITDSGLIGHPELGENGTEAAVPFP